jgi:hypothetical protein
VTDDQTPPLGATNCFRVIVNSPCSPPLILFLRLTNKSATLSWTSVAGRTYRLQYKDSHSDTAWVDVVPDAVATASTATASIPLDEDAARFYQVVLLPLIRESLCNASSASACSLSSVNKRAGAGVKKTSPILNRSASRRQGESPLAATASGDTRGRERVPGRMERLLTTAVVVRAKQDERAVKTGHSCASKRGI